MTKCGDTYLRTLLVHGSRAAVRSALGRNDPRRQWIAALVQRRGHNKAVVAVANKNVRVLWAPGDRTLGHLQLFRGTHDFSFDQSKRDASFRFYPSSDRQEETGPEEDTSGPIFPGPR